MKKVSKTETEKQIKEFFSNIKDKTPKDIKKIKKLAMNHNIKLGELKKRFCKKCYSVYRKPKIRIKNNVKSVSCENCGYVSR
jgi:RNase P subunit RPR2